MTLTCLSCGFWTAVQLLDTSWEERMYRSGLHRHDEHDGEERCGGPKPCVVRGHSLREAAYAQFPHGCFLVESLALAQFLRLLGCLAGLDLKQPA